MSKTISTEAQDARGQLAALLPAGSTAFTVIRNVSASGMTRAISVVICEAGEPRDISWLIRRAELGFTVNPRHGGCVVKGAGMDMAFHLVYSISSSLHGDGYAISQRAL